MARLTALQRWRSLTAAALTDAELGLALDEATQSGDHEAAALIRAQLQDRAASRRSRMRRTLREAIGLVDRRR